MLDDLKPIYPNEERLWQLFLQVHDSSPAVPSRSAVHTRVQIAYAILQQYEKEVEMLREKERTKKTPMLIDELELTARDLRCLRLEEITTVDQLCAMTENQVLRIPNLGRKALNNIKEELLKLGRELAKD